MEKFNFKDMEKSREFQAGLKEFREGKIKNEIHEGCCDGE